MTSSDVWSSIHAERQALARDLESLTEAQWKTPSPCEGWSIREVLGHLTSTAELTAPKFFAGRIGAVFASAPCR